MPPGTTGPPSAAAPPVRSAGERPPAADLPDRSEVGRLPGLAARGVQVLSVLIALVELARLGFTGDEGKVALGAAATALYLPLHVQHLRYGLRGRRPPRALLTLAAMAVVEVAALLLVGASWPFTLATLATSALIVLRLPWALAVLAACCAAPALAQALDLGPADLATNGNAGYVAYAIAFRATVQFSLVWLVAALHQASSARAALAQEGVDRERRRIEAQVREAVQRRLDLLVAAGRRARAALTAADARGAEDELGRVVQLARDALTDLRRIVGTERAPSSSTASVELARASRSAASPVGGILVRSRAWVVFAAVHVVVIAFPAVTFTGLSGGAPTPNGGLAIVAWAVVAAAYGGLLVALRRRPALVRPRTPAALAVAILLAATVAVLPVWPFGDNWPLMSWFIGAAIVMTFPGRLRLLGIVPSLGLVLYIDFHTPAQTVGLFGPTEGQLWYLAYSMSIVLLTILGLVAAVRLVPLTAELEATRTTLARNAVDTERRRFSGDLHDILGQSLTMLSLKGDIARRLVTRDAERAAGELDDVLRVAEGQAAELDAVAGGERRVRLRVEIDEAVAVLDTVGVAAVVDLRVALGDIDEATSTLLGWVVREGTTNALRHATPSRVTLRLRRDRERVVLELENDGVRASAGPAGIGLANLADRLADVGGTIAPAPGPGRTFGVVVAVPAAVAVGSAASAV